MNKQEKKQLEIAKKIVEQGNCIGIDCYDSYGLFDGAECPFGEVSCRGKEVDLAKAFIKDHSKISKKDLLKRVEKLERRVGSMEESCIPGGCSGSEDAKELKRHLEQDILSLVVKYEERTGLKVSEIDLVTSLIGGLRVTNMDYILKTKVTL